MDTKPADRLSQATRAVLSSRPDAYEQLVVAPGDAPGADVRRQLEALADDALLTRAVTSREHRDALLAGLWLWHDCLDESHTISQRLDTPTGSFWHAVMHRREGDFSNAKYWYARCRNHPAMLEIGRRSELQGVWNPNAFVDLVDRVPRNCDDPRYRHAVELQRIEWAVLFDHCVRDASGG